ncbi:putative MFS-type transporter YcaD [compost metagenome]
MAFLTSKSNKLFSPFVILLSVIVLGGVSQGLLLPLLSIFMEERGIPSSVNGMHAAALYIGSFAMSLVAERVLGVTGFKKLLLGGLTVVLISLPLFPLVSDLKLWFVLRLLVGIGDSAIHFTSQLWLLLVSPPERRGRNISLYGMSYGLGFSLGPLGIHLLPLGKLLPFVILTVLFMAMIMLVIVKMPDMRPEKFESGEGASERKFVLIYRAAWFALLPSLLFGYMESSMNSNFPIYGLRIGLSTGEISTLLPFFGIGGLILQLPLGILSDRFGRKRVLMVAGLLGGLMFLLIPLYSNQFWALMILFMLSGGFVGSFFSLGLAYAADILPKHWIPAANVIASFHFSLGSIAGPNLGGQVMEMGRAGMLFTLLGSAYLLFSIAGLAFRKNSTKKLEI